MKIILTITFMLFPLFASDPEMRAWYEFSNKEKLYERQLMRDERGSQLLEEQTSACSDAMHVMFAPKKISIRSNLEDTAEPPHNRIDIYIGRLRKKEALENVFSQSAITYQFDRTMGPRDYYWLIFVINHSFDTKTLPLFKVRVYNSGWEQDDWVIAKEGSHYVIRPAANPDQWVINGNVQDGFTFEKQCIGTLTSEAQHPD